MLTDAQKMRLAGAVKDARRDAGWRILKQFILAETGSDEPDMAKLKHFIVERLSEAVDADIRDALALRERERALG